MPNTGFSRALNRAITSTLFLSLLVVQAARPQSSDEKCTVTANGQTTQVRSDGSYLIQNIPVGNGLVRVEASCIRDGVTLYGVSIFKGLSNGQTVEFGPLPLSPEPIPTVVTIRASSPGTLPDIGETGQITVQALLSDESTSDVTPREQGSAYSSSNSAIVSVGPDGLVTAVDRGTASITVTNQGATSTVRVAVAPPDDPLTTVEGFVFDPDGNPVAGAVVEDIDHGDSTVTDSNGFFCLGCPDGGPPALDGDLRIRAEADVDGRHLEGLVTNLTPRPGAITDAGILTLQDLLSESTFDSDDEGWDVWTSIGTYSVSYSSNGGSPGGYIWENDPDASVFYFSAPQAFRGDKTDLYAGFVSFDLSLLWDGGRESDAESDVVMIGNGIQIHHDFGDITFNPGPDWGRFFVPVKELAWHLPDGSPLSKAQLMTVLSSLHAFRIRGEYIDSSGGFSERCQLDTVRFWGRSR